MKKVLPAALLVLAAWTLQAQPDTSALFEMSIEEMMDYEVETSTKSGLALKKAPSVITVLYKEDWATFPARNLGEVLNFIVGTSFHHANYFTDNVVQFRGQSITPYNNHVLILLNGRPIRDPISGGLNAQVYKAFPLGVIQRIEIIRGPGSVLYGSCAVSGIINIITKTPGYKKMEAQVRSAAGTHGLWQNEASLQLKTEMAALTTGLRYENDPGEKLAFTDNLGQEGSARFSSQSIGAYMGLSLLNMDANLAYTGYLPYALGGANLDWQPDKALDNNDNHSLMADLSYHYKFWENITTQFNFTYNEHRWIIEGGDKQIGRDLLAEASAQYEAEGPWKWLAGFTSEQEKIEGTILANSTTDILSFYLQSEYQPSETVYFIGGLQLNKPGHIAANLSPRAGMVWHLHPKLTGKLLFSEAFRKAYPLETSSDLPVFRGNPDLKPELIRTAENQWIFTQQHMHLALTGYFSRISQLITRKSLYSHTGEFMYLQYQNGGYHDYWGIEAEMRLRLYTGLALLFGGTYQENWNDEKQINAALHPNWKLKTRLQYRRKTYSLGLFYDFSPAPYRVSHTHPQVVQANPSPRAMHRLNARILWTPFYRPKQEPKLDAQIFAEAYNLLGRQMWYPEYTSRNINTLIPWSGERQFLLGATLRFHKY